MAVDSRISVGMTAFSFGENWLRYSNVLNESRLGQAETSLQNLLARERLDGLSVLDVGSGSALFAIAAVRLGAARVVAVDRDPNSVLAGARNVSRFLSGEAQAKITLRSGDILQSPSGIEHFDLVYAWGSLHHTGAMWVAIDNAVKYCRPGGQFVLAIYNKTWLSPTWLHIKRLYHRAPAPFRMAMALALAGTRVVARVLQLKWPFSVDRGMTVWYDAIDWLGGLPYEYATADEVCDFLRRRGGIPARTLLTRRSGCNQFVFTLEARQT